VLLEHPGSGAPKAGGPKDAKAPAAGWSAGVEAAGKTPEKSQQQAPQPAGAQNSGNFEAQIREVLGNQQRPLGDSYTGGDPQYRTQSYSRGGVKAEE
jgi:hypothetical protein